MGTPGVRNWMAVTTSCHMGCNKGWSQRSLTWLAVSVPGGTVKGMTRERLDMCCRCPVVVLHAKAIF